MTYSFNPHRHTKIWLSKNPNVFMNFENQMRLVEMRNQNLNDIIHLVYDSSLLNKNAQQNLQKFCHQHQFTPIDIDDIQRTELTKEENRLLDYYYDEIQHIKEGGNLAVASDILRWISPIYKLGSYTDFDVPVNTQNLANSCPVKSPILLNIGSLKIGKNELILSNNDFISITDPEAATEQIKTVQNNILSTLDEYHTDFIETATAALGSDHFLYTRFSRYMKSRSESEYMGKSEQLNCKHKKTSRELRKLINEVTSNPKQYIDFNRLTKEETDSQVITRLRKELHAQLSLIKWFFFNKEYSAIQSALKQSDDKFIAYCTQRDRALYTKSIVVCTTGPIAIARALFGNYVLNSSEFNEKVTSASIHHYALEKHFQSQNAIKLHENALGMLRFLGKADGELNDSSWLEEGEKLQKSRETVFFEKLKNELYELKKSINQRLHTLEKPKFGLSFMSKNQTQTEQLVLEHLLECFNIDHDSIDLEKFSSLKSNPSQKLTPKTKQVIETAFILQAQLKQLQTIDLTSVQNNPFVKYKQKDCFTIQPKSNFYLKSEDHVFKLIKKKTALQQLLNICLTPIQIIRWAISFIVVRILREIILAPTQVRTQNKIHHIAMENADDDLVIINLSPKISFKRLKDRFFKLSEWLGLENQNKTIISLKNQDHKNHIDTLIQEINKLRTGTSQKKRCQGKNFPWHSLYFKGLERFDIETRKYFLEQIGHNETESIEQTPRIEFFKLNTQDGSMLDSISISASLQSEIPMSERKYVINCIEREQNYVNWIKDATHVSKKTNSTVILFNYRGIDESRGVVWTQNDLVADAMAQVQRLIALGAQPQNITLEGNCLGGTIATIAAAQLHQEGYPVKLYNLRSFQSVHRFLIGYLMPEQSTAKLTEVRYLIAKIIAVLLSPLIYLSGWTLNAKKAWDIIPRKDKDYGVICAAPNSQKASAEDLDNIIHHSYASIAGHMEQQRTHILAKQYEGQSLTPEEIKIVADEPSNHYFSVSQNSKTDDNEARLNKIKQFGRSNHFAPRHSLKSTVQPELSYYDRLAHFART